MAFRCQRIQCTLIKELHRFQTSAFPSMLLFLPQNLEKKAVCCSTSAVPLVLTTYWRAKTKAYISIKAGSGTGMGTAGSNELFQRALARISSYCHVILTHLENKHLQSYISSLRFVYQEKINLEEIRIPRIEVIVHKHLLGGFS